MDSTTEHPRCSVPDCMRPVLSREMCNMHYQRWSKTGDPGEAGARYQKKPDVCIVDGCLEKVKAKSYCFMHYKRWRKTGDPGPCESKRKVRVTGPCRFPDCKNQSYVNGLCSAHHRQMKQGKELQPLRSMAARGSGGVGAGGYRRIQIDGRRLPQHQLVVEERLGRELLPAETVHHKNGIRDDNRPDNLELWDSNHPAGQRRVDKLEWMLEYIAQFWSENEMAEALTRHADTCDVVGCICCQQLLDNNLRPL